MPTLQTHIQHTCATTLAGDIACIRGERLHVLGADGSYQFSKGDQFGIVSDTHAKWKGGYKPKTAEEERTVSSTVSFTVLLLSGMHL